MRPQNTRVWRKTRHQALRGVPTGRRATHEVQTTYGHRQRERERQARFAELFRALREERAAREAVDAA